MSPSADHTPATRLASPWMDGLLLALVVVALWSSGFDGVFLLDDYPAIVENPALIEPWPPFAAMSPPPEVPGAGRPLVGLSLAINRALGGLEVRGYHLLNTAVHLLATWLLYGCVRRGLKLAGHPAIARAAALATALLWAIHPLQTEPVLYILQRSQLMMGACLLATLWCFLRGVESPRAGRWYAGATMACAAGMACKEEMIVAPLLVWLFDAIFVAGGFVAALRARRVLYAGLAAGWALLAALIASGPDYGAMGMGLDTGISPWGYLLNQPGILLGYLGKVFVPHPLVLDYGQARELSFAAVAPAFLVIAAAVVATTWGIIRRHPLGFCGAWFFLLLAPTSSIVPVASEVGAERRMYLPLAIVVLLVVLGAGALARRAGATVRSWGPLPATSAPALLLLVAAAGLCAWGTVRRAADYGDAERMWRSVNEARPGWRAEHNLGVLLLERGDPAGALPHFERAAALGVHLAEPANAQGVALLQLGRNAEARAAFDEALRREPGHAPALTGLGLWLAAEGRAGEALPYLRSAVENDPGNAGLQSNLGTVLQRLGQIDAAIAAYDRALQLDPGLPDAWLNRGVALGTLGRRDEAIASLERALGLRPGDALAQQYLRQLRGEPR